MNKLRVYLAMGLAVLFWGFSFIWSKQALQYYGPITVIFLRLLLSVFFLFLLGKAFRLLEKPARKDWRLFVSVAFWEPFAYFIGESFGLKYVSSTTAAVIIATIPLFSPIAAYFFHSERLKLMNVFGIIISIIGVSLVVLNKDFGLKASWIGIAFMLWAVFSAVFYSVFVYDLAKKYNTFTIIFYQNLLGGLMFMPLFLIFELKPFVQVGFVPQAILAIVLLAIFASSLAFMFFTYGIRYLGVTRANLMANLIPIVTAFLSHLILNETFTWFNVLGILMVVFGVFLGEL